METKNTPIHKIRAGTMEVSVWKNTATKTINGQEITYNTYSITHSKGYKDKTGNWQNTTSLNTTDIPKLREMLREAYAWIISQTNNDE